MVMKQELSMSELLTKIVTQRILVQKFSTCIFYFKLF